MSGSDPMASDDAQRLRGSVGHGATIATCQVGGEPPSSLPPLSQGEFGYA